MYSTTALRTGCAEIMYVCIGYYFTLELYLL